MKIPKISEEERDELHTALKERSESLEKKKKDAEKMGVPMAAAGFDERLRLYRDSEQIILGRRVPIAGLLTMFSAEPELSAEGRAARDNQAEVGDLWEGVATEVGGGIPAHKTSDRWKGGIDVPEPGAEPETRESRLLQVGGKCAHGVPLAEECEACLAEQSTEDPTVSDASADAPATGEDGTESLASDDVQDPSSSTEPQIKRGETWRDPRSDPEPGTSGGGVGPEPEI